MSEKTWYLKHCELFERLAPEHLEQLESCARICRFPRKTLVYLPADQSDGVLLLAAGRVRICTLTDEGKQAILAFIEPGELFGELAILESGRREEYAETCEPSTVVLIPTDAMRRLVEGHVDISLGITKLIGLRRRRVERRLKSLLFRSNRERLIHLLLELAEQYGMPTAEGVQLRIKLSHQDLANVIGSTRESVTIALGQLQADGELHLGRQKILLCDPARLAGSIKVPPPEIKGNGRPAKSTTLL